jgi:hypothetical protein
MPDAVEHVDALVGDVLRAQREVRGEQRLGEHTGVVHVLRDVHDLLARAVLVALVLHVAEGDLVVEDPGLEAPRDLGAAFSLMYHWPRVSETRSVPPPSARCS